MPRFKQRRDWPSARDPPQLRRLRGQNRRDQAHTRTADPRECCGPSACGGAFPGNCKAVCADRIAARSSKNPGRASFVLALLLGNQIPRTFPGLVWRRGSPRHVTSVSRCHFTICFCSHSDPGLPRSRFSFIGCHRTMFARSELCQIWNGLS
jgi:hypothetical protein